MRTDFEKLENIYEDREKIKELINNQLKRIDYEFRVDAGYPFGRLTINEAKSDYKHLLEILDTKEALSIQEKEYFRKIITERIEELPERDKKVEEERKSKMQNNFDGFFNKIREAITKFQEKLPVKLSEEKIEAIEQILKEYVLDSVEKGEEEEISLVNLIGEAIYKKTKLEAGKTQLVESKEEKEMLTQIANEKVSKNMPYLKLWFSKEFFGIKNHENQVLFSSDKHFKPVEKYFLISNEDAIGKIEKEQSDDELSI